MMNYDTSGRSDDGQHLSFLQRKADILQHLCPVKTFIQMLYFQYCHQFHLLSEIIQFLLQSSQEHRKDPIEDKIINSGEKQWPDHARDSLGTFQE